MTEPMTCYRHPDRETRLSCSHCGRPICTDCMTVAHVGLRCPEHAGGRPQAATRVARRRTPHRISIAGPGALVTKAIIAVSVAVYLIGVADGGSINSPGGEVFVQGALYGPAVGDGDWWRLITSVFLHANLLHIGLNMLAVWWFGAAVEEFLGRWRFASLYLVSGLAGSAGALLASPNDVTVGASGAIFGILGAMLIIQWQQTGSFSGNALTLIALNLVFTFAVPNISIGGHLGGLAGGILGTLALARFGRGHAAYGRPGLLGVASLAAIGVLSVLIAYWKVRGFA